MKKILSLLVLLVAFASCEEDIKFNNPAVQGLKDNELWRATEFSAEKFANSVVITAKNDVETVVITLNAPAPDSVHDLGVNDLNTASYNLNVDGIQEFYTTGTNVGNGRVILRGAIDNDLVGTNGKGYISGSFYFNAVKDDEAGKIVNFQQGVFFKVPLTINQ